MIVWKSPPSALHSLSITVSIFSGVNRNLKRSHWELLGSINGAAGGKMRPGVDTNEKTISSLLEGSSG